MSAAPTPTAIMVIDDLFFVAKVQSPLAALGFAPRALTQCTALAAYLQTAPAPALMVVDLTLRQDDAVAMIRTMRSSPAGASVPILAFGSHVAVDVTQQARAAGATKVVAKSALSQHFVELVQALMSQESDPTS